MIIFQWSADYDKSYLKVVDKKLYCLKYAAHLSSVIDISIRIWNIIDSILAFFEAP